MSRRALAPARLSMRDVEAASLRDAHDPRPKRLDLGVAGRLLGVQHAIGFAGRRESERRDETARLQVVLDQRMGRNADAEPARRGLEHEIGVLEALALLDVDAGGVDVPRPIGPGLQARLGMQQLVVTQIRNGQLVAALEQRRCPHRPDAIGEKRRRDHVARPRAHAPRPSYDEFSYYIDETSFVFLFFKLSSGAAFPAVRFSQPTEGAALSLVAVVAIFL